MNSNPTIPLVPPATPADIQAITDVCHDYTAGWFTGDAERMRRALHPDLVKRTIWHDPQTESWQVEPTLTAEKMVSFTAHGGGTKHPKREQVYEITVLDAFRHVATVKVSSYPYMDYLHLAKINGRWYILNCLYELREGEQPEP